MKKEKKEKERRKGAMPAMPAAVQPGIRYVHPGPYVRRGAQVQAPEKREECPWHDYMRHQLHDSYDPAHPTCPEEKRPKWDDHMKVIHNGYATGNSPACKEERRKLL